MNVTVLCFSVSTYCTICEKIEDTRQPWWEPSLFLLLILTFQDSSIILSNVRFFLKDCLNLLYAMESSNHKRTTMAATVEADHDHDASRKCSLHDEPRRRNYIYPLSGSSLASLPVQSHHFYTFICRLTKGVSTNDTKNLNRPDWLNI